MVHKLSNISYLVGIWAFEYVALMPNSLLLLSSLVPLKYRPILLVLLSLFHMATIHIPTSSELRHRSVTEQTTDRQKPSEQAHGRCTNVVGHVN